MTFASEEDKVAFTVHQWTRSARLWGTTDSLVRKTSTPLTRFSAILLWTRLAGFTQISEDTASCNVEPMQVGRTSLNPEEQRTAWRIFAFTVVGQAILLQIVR